MKPLYQGEAFEPDDILEMLRSQGLQIDDPDRARHILENVSYTRLKNYLVSLMDNRQTHHFRPGASFEDAYALYGFDRRLRELVFHELEKIEISFRTRMAYVMNGKEKGYWFLNPEHFRNASRHNYILGHISQELKRSDNEAIAAFYEKYSNEFPPSWITLEAASMGTLWTIYDELGDPELRERIASYYGMTPRVFSSWAKHLVSVRNSCAHHNRFWNNRVSSLATLPEDMVFPFPKMEQKDRIKVYFTCCIIKYFQDRIKPNNTFAQRLKELVGNFKMVDPAQMGFPRLWTKEDFWK